MSAKLETIHQDLERLRAVRPRPQVFGAESHGFVLNSPLSAAAVETFEAKHRVRLPADYRRFLIEVGNGGAGPYYGIFKLGEMDDSFGFQRWSESDGFVGVLSRPFPHTEAWNDLTGEPEDEGDEEAFEEFDKQYWSSERVNGAIPICHEGCAIRDWLVVSGPEAGHIWHDARVDEEGLRPVSIGTKTRVTFLEWYLHWLDAALARLRSG